MQLFRQRKTRPSGIWERGQVLAEFGIVATVFFLFLFGIFDFARMFQSWITIQHSAREAARYGITGLDDCDGATDDRTACLVWTAEEQTLGLPGGGVGSGLVDVDYTYWDYPDYAGAGAEGAGGPCDAIEVRVTYQHSFVTPLIKPVMGVLGEDPITLQGIQRMTNEPWGSCAPPASP